VKEVVFYLTEKGERPVANWLKSLDKVIVANIAKRFERIIEGNYGDYKLLGDGIFELRFHFGSGYRVYCGEDGDTLVILLYGGDKKSQRKDVDKAKEYWQNYLNRKAGKQ